MAHRKRNNGTNQSRGSKSKKAFSAPGICKGDRCWFGKNGIPANTRALLKANLRREVEDTER